MALPVSAMTALIEWTEIDRSPRMLSRSGSTTKDGGGNAMFTFVVWAVGIYIILVIVSIILEIFE